MRFQRRTPRRSPWETLDARRKMAFLGILVAAVVFMNFAVDSWVPTPAERQEQLPSASVPTPKIAPPDFAAPERPDAANDDEDILPPGAFRSEPEIAESSSEEGEGAPRPSPLESPSNSGQTQTSLSPDLLALIRDDTLNIRGSERPAYLGMLEKAQELPDQILEDAAIRNLNYTELFGEADRYRGHVVTIEGRVKRLSKFNLADGSEDLKTIYEAWIFTPDSGMNPYVFHATEIPAALSTEGEIDEQVRVTGYFFKRYQYPTVKGLYSAPMLLGKRIRLIPAVVVKETESTLVPYFVLALTFVGAALAVTVWRFSAGDRQFHREHMQRVRTVEGETVSQVEKVDPEDLSLVFQQLAKAAEEEETESED